MQLFNDQVLVEEARSRRSALLHDAEQRRMVKASASQGVTFSSRVLAHTAQTLIRWGAFLEQRAHLTPSHR